MNQHFDPATFILDQFDALGRADRCRVLDKLLQSVGPDAPIPVFEDVRADADGWAALTDLRTQSVYMVAMWAAWPAEKQQECIDWMVKNKKREAGKAEPRGG